MKKIVLGFIFGVLATMMIANISVSFAIEDFKVCAENSHPDTWNQCYAERQGYTSRKVANSLNPSSFMSDLFVETAFDNVRMKLYEMLRRMQPNQGGQI